MPFLLDKWYMDAVADDGRAAIAYHLVLRVAGIDLRIGSVLERSTTGAITQRTRVGRVPPVDGAGLTTTWNAPELEFQARWEGVDVEPVERELFADRGRSIRWMCRVPNAAAYVQSRGQRWTGRGYVERLTTNLTPWRMPIDCLWWGRFTGSRSSVVWIRWDGPKPLSLILLDGGEVQGQVETHRVIAGEAVLELDPGATLRDGDIAMTILGELPIAHHFAKRARWGVHERKWLSRGTLLRPAAASEAGWVIHERVWFRTSGSAGGHAT